MSFIKCKTCRVEVPSGKCVFAIHRRIIDGKEYVFCCPTCADEFQKKLRKSKG